jgi:hypothetical protein
MLPISGSTPNSTQSLVDSIRSGKTDAPDTSTVCRTLLSVSNIATNQPLTSEEVKTRREMREEEVHAALGNPRLVSMLLRAGPDFNKDVTKLAIKLAVTDLECRFPASHYVQMALNTMILNRN